MTNDISRPLALIILDGWGIGPTHENNAIARAHTPNYDLLCRKYPWTVIEAAGSRVGLADGACGNPEVGHLTIGAGRVVQTEAARILKAVDSGEISENPVLRSAFDVAAKSGSNIHFVGLISDSELHSSQETLYALLRMAKRNSVSEVFVHAILDGRDVSPRTADIYLEALEIKMNDIGIGRIASLCGRFYAMDSTENWARTARAFTMLVHGEGERSLDAVSAVRGSFLRGISDEFIAPVIIEKKFGEPVAVIKEGDLVVFFNHNPDGMRQLVRSLSSQEESAQTPIIDIVCLAEYDPAFGLPVAFDRHPEANVLGQIFERNGIRNYRISESSRLVHVSSYLNCGMPTGHSFEDHVIVPSLAARYLDSAPESKSFKVADRFLRTMESDDRAVFVINFPAPDMLADRGDLDKTIEAVQFVDTCLGGVVEAVEAANGIAVVTSSHGNCEEAGNGPVGRNRAGGTVNPVPLHIVDRLSSQMSLAADGSLADVAPTLLGLLGLPRPEEMTGRDLRRG